MPHPPEWDVAAVGKSIELKRGVSWAKSQEYTEPGIARLPVVRIGNVQSRLDLSDLLYLSDLPAHIAHEKHVGDGWTLIVGSNGNRNRIGNAVYVAQAVEMLFASFLLAAKPFPSSKITPGYFFRWLTRDPVQAHLSASSEGTTGLSNLSHSFLRAMTIAYPSVREQDAIVRALDVADTAIARTQRVLDCLATLKRSLLQRLLADGLRGEPRKKTRIGDIPQSWDAVPLASVVSSFQYGLSMAMSASGEVPILRMGNIQDGDVRPTNLKYVTLPADTMSAYLVKRGDILFNRTNSQEWVGKVGIYRDDTPSVFASYLIRVVPYEARVDPYYLGHVLGSYSVQCRIKRYATPGVEQVNINATNLGKVIIPVPSGPKGLAEQREIAAILEAVESVRRGYEAVVCAQQDLCRSVGHDLLTGRVRLVRETVSA